MHGDKLAIVRRLPLFKAMSEQGFDRLVANAYLQKFPPATVLLESGQRPDFLHVVIEGAVELYAESSGRVCSMAVLEPITTFITAAAVQESVYLMSGRTMTQATILLIPVEEIRHAIATESGFAQAIIMELARGYRLMVRTLKNFKLRNTVERLANYLLIEERRQGGTGRLRLKLEKRVLASLLGSTPENLSRAFGTLRKHGVAVKGAEIVILDKTALSSFALPDGLIHETDETQAAMGSY